jgi:hypothetical protein
VSAAAHIHITDRKTAPMRFMGSPPESLPRSIPGRDVRSLVETAVLRRGWDADEAMLEAEAKAERV